MNRKGLKLVGYAVLICITMAVLLVLYPRTYNVPTLVNRDGTHYWTLPTGSRIAFWVTAAKTRRQRLPIVYLHGGPGGHIRASIVKTLSPLTHEGFDIYFYDQVGSGLSDRLTDIRNYTVERQIQDLAAIIDKLGSGKVILIGQSWGAVLATLFTARYPEKIERLVLTSPGPIFPIRRNLVKLQTPDSIHLTAPMFTNDQGNKKAANIRTNTMKFFATRFGFKLASDKEADAFATYLSYQVDRSTVCDTAQLLPMDAGDGFYASIMTFADLIKIKDYRSALRQVKINVLIMKGECDNQPWGYTKEYLDVFAYHTLAVLPGAGHFLWVEQQSLYVNAIRQFLLDDPGP